MRLSGLDASFLCLEGSTRSMHMGALLIFDPPNAVPPARIAHMLSSRAATVPQLTRSLRWTWWPEAGAEWTEDRAFAVEDHVQTHELNGPEHLATAVAELMAEPLPAGRPPWELHVLSGLGDSRFAVLAKLHHAMADGAGAIMVAGTLFDDLVGPAGDRLPGGEAGPCSAGSSLFDRLRAWPSRALRNPADLVSGIAEDIATRTRRLGQVVGIASSTLAAVRPLSVASPVTNVVGSSSRRNWAGVRLDADHLHRARKQLGGTFNDVVLSVVAGGLRDWLRQNGDAATLAAGWTARAFIPVSLRGRQVTQSGGGNHLSGYLCDLPLGEPDPVERLNAVREGMQRNKAAGPTRGAGAFPLVADALPALAHRFAAPVLGRAAPLLFDTMITSVPLPDIPLRLDGAVLREIHPIAPLAPGQGLSVAVTAYNGVVQIGLLTDPDLLPGVDRLADAIIGAADTLHQACAGDRDGSRPA